MRSLTIRRVNAAPSASRRLLVRRDPACTLGYGEQKSGRLPPSVGTRSASVGGSGGRTRTRMKVNLFQQVPYRFLPAGFEDQGHLVRGVDAVRRARRTGADVRLLPVVHGRSARRSARRVRWDRGHGARADVVRHDAEPQPAGGGVGERDSYRTARDGIDRLWVARSARPASRSGSPRSTRCSTA